MARLRIGELLVEARVISQAHLEEALRSPRAEGQKIGQVLVDLGFITETQLTQTLSQQLSVPWVSLYHVDFSRDLLNRVPRELAERLLAVPIFVRQVKKQGSFLYVAMDDPTNEAALAELAKAAGLPVKPMIACPTDIRNAIRVYYADNGEAAASPPTMRDRVEARQAQIPPAPAAAQSGAAALAASQPTSVTASPIAAAAPPRPSQGGPPPPPPVGRPPLPTVVDSAELVAARMQADALAEAQRVPTEEIEAASVPAPASEDSPDASPELEVGEYVPKRPSRPRARMVSLTLLDGTQINVPAARGSAPPSTREPQAGAARESQPGAARESQPGAQHLGVNDALTARDLVSALRAVSHGADASEVLGATEWQALFAALLSLLLKKNLIADWEFVDELRKV